MTSIAIVAHPIRLGMARELADRVIAEAITVDNAGRGPGINHLRAWGWLNDSDSGDWAVVLEDDAVPVGDFRNQLNAALAIAPADIVSLYLGRGRPPQYQRWIAQAISPLDTDPHWLIAAHMFHAVGYAVRRHLIEDLLQGVAPLVGKLPIDEAVSKWAQEANHLVAYTRPSLVNHRDTVSLALHQDGQPRTELRVAWICGERRSWSRHSAPLPVGDQYDPRVQL